MAKPRRTPPLFEVMKEPLRRVQHGGASGAPPGAKPIHGPASGSERDSEPPPAPIPISQGSEAAEDRRGFASPAPPRRALHEPTGVSVEVSGQARSPATDARTEGVSRRRLFSWPSALIALAAGLGIVLLVWAVAYRLGAANERNRLAEFSSTPPGEPGPGASSRDPLRPEGDVGGADPRPQPRPQPRPPEPVGAGTLGLDPRQAGHNYLIIAQLNAKDAEAAVAWLNSGGIRATAFPKRRIDPTRADAGQLLAAARAKNDLFWVIDSEGVPSAEYREQIRRSDNPIAAKINKVIELGRKWRREARGASNFDTAYYERYSGN